MIGNQPFGNGNRSCIGRDFAWQEATLVVTMLLQNFDFRLEDPRYELQIQQTLTVKPENMFLYATPRQGLDPIVIEKRLHAADSFLPSASNDSKSMTSREDTSHRPMTVFFGGNMGTCESLAQTVGKTASSHGYKAQVRPLDDAARNMPKDQPILLITSSYEGQPPDNACNFIEWIERVEEKPLSGVSYAVFGCGNRTLALQPINVLLMLTVLCKVTGKIHFSEFLKSVMWAWKEQEPEDSSIVGRLMPPTIRYLTISRSGKMENSGQV